MGGIFSLANDMEDIVLQQHGGKSLPDSFPDGGSDGSNGLYIVKRYTWIQRVGYSDLNQRNTAAEDKSGRMSWKSC